MCRVMVGVRIYVEFFCVFKQKTAYEMRISDWSSDVCSSDLGLTQFGGKVAISIERGRIELLVGKAVQKIGHAAAPVGGQVFFQRLTREIAELGVADRKSVV